LLSKISHREFLFQVEELFLKKKLWSLCVCRSIRPVEHDISILFFANIKLSWVKRFYSLYILGTTCGWRVLFCYQKIYGINVTSNHCLFLNRVVLGIWYISKLICKWKKHLFKYISNAFVYFITTSVACAVGTTSVNPLQNRDTPTCEHCFAMYVSIFWTTKYERKSCLNRRRNAKPKLSSHSKKFSFGLDVYSFSPCNFYFISLNSAIEDITHK
jgi:hypothetical protein